MAELIYVQSHALRVLASAVAGSCVDRARFVELLELHSARLQYAEPHPIAEELIEDVIRDLRGIRD